MKKIIDYTFYSSWQLKTVNIKPNEEYVVLMDIGNLKKGEVVKFIGFDDVDNHYGIFVFTDMKEKVLEISGDFSGPSHACLKELEAALLKN